MKELYVEGLATHNGPEPCALAREDESEALDRGMCRPGIEPRNQCNRGADAVRGAEGNTIGSVTREPPMGRARSKTLCMRRISMRENRETSRLPVWLITGQAAQGRPRPQA